jgi:hypothetical protein
MKKILFLGPRLNLSRWGPLLLAAGLLLVFVQGLLQLYEVQNFFSPDKYQAIKLNLIKKEYFKIDQGLTSLQDQLTILTMLQQARAKPDPVPSSRPLSASPSPLPAAEARCSPDLSWQAAIHAAKKKRVYVARKLNHLRLILQSMQRDLEAKLSDIGSESSARKPEMEKTLQQIRENRALWQTYDDNLNDLSIKLKKIAECSSNQQSSTISQNKKR